MYEAARSIPGMILIALLAGCTSVSVSPDVMVNIPPANDAKWTMNIGQKVGPDAGLVTLFINGTVLGSSDWSQTPANIKGSYSGHAVQALCTQAGTAQQQDSVVPVYRGTCVVYVDGTQVATLPF